MARLSLRPVTSVMEELRSTSFSRLMPSGVISNAQAKTNTSDKPIEDLDVSEETAELLMDVAYFEPLPFVDRAIFIATPHRGSFVADTWVGRMARKFVSLPGDLAHATFEILRLRADGPLDEVSGGTSIDNMQSDNPFLTSLADIPVDEGVTAHSIIAVQGDGPVEEGDDGVVEYTSAHIDGVSSELVVRSGHATQSEPATIEEVRRILIENIGEK